MSCGICSRHITGVMRRSGSSSKNLRRNTLRAPRRLSNSWGGTRTRDPGIMSAVL